MGNYANLMWMPIINALITCGVIIARSIVTLEFTFGRGDSTYDDSSVHESLNWDPSGKSSHLRSSANTQEFFEPTRLRIFFAVHHFSLDIILAAIALQMVLQLYKRQRIGPMPSGTSPRGTNFVGLANFFGVAAFMTFLGHIFIWKILPWLNELNMSMPRIVLRIVPLLFMIGTSAYCILQSVISHLHINTHNSPVATTDNWNDVINRHSTRVTFVEKQTVFLRIFCTGAVVLLSIVLAVGMLSMTLSPASMEIIRKILGAAVAAFFLTYIPLFRTIPCTSSHRTSNTGDRSTAGNTQGNYPTVHGQTTNHLQGNYPTAHGQTTNHPQGNYPTAHGQTGLLPPQTLPPPPGYDELYNNQGGHERIPMTPVYVRPLGPNTGYVEEFGIDGPRDGP